MKRIDFICIQIFISKQICVFMAPSSLLTAVAAACSCAYVYKHRNMWTEQWNNNMNRFECREIEWIWENTNHVISCHVMYNSAGGFDPALDFVSFCFNFFVCCQIDDFWACARAIYLLWKRSNVCVCPVCVSMMYSDVSHNKPRGISERRSDATTNEQTVHNPGMERRNNENS